MLQRLSRPPASAVWVMGLLLAVLHVTLTVTAWSGKGQVFDEPAHIVSGYSYWHLKDYRLHPENGNLPQRWAALPLTFMDLKFADTTTIHWHVSDVWGLAHEFFFELGNDLATMLFRARLMIALVSGVFSLVVLGWAWRLWGVGGGLLAQWMYVLSPTMLAHGGVATSDLFAALFFLAATGAVWIMLHRVSWWTVLGAGLALAGLALSKMSAVLILPIAVILVTLRLARGKPLQVRLIGRQEVSSRIVQVGIFTVCAGAQLAIVVLAIWAALGFRYDAFVHDVHPQQMYYRDLDSVITDAGLLGGFISMAREHHLLPDAYLYGFAHVLAFAQRRTSFAAGQFSYVGFPWFFPYAFILKTGLGELALMVMACLAAVRGGPWRDWVYRLAPLWALILVYGLTSLTTSLNIGHRHLLPLYPPLFILAGAAARWAGGLATHRAVCVWIAAAVLTIESFFIYPHYLAFFNLFAGGPSQGYRHLVDSSLDWGQELPGLKRWLDDNELSNQQHTPVYLSYFGTGYPAYYGIQAMPLTGYGVRGKPILMVGPLTGGYYCISATALQQVYTNPAGRWSADYEKQYLFTSGVAKRYYETRNDPPARAALEEEFGEELYPILLRFAELRLGRLCAKLRQREPDDTIGHAMLIYRVTSEELRSALLDLPAELFPDAQIRGWPPPIEEIRRNAQGVRWPVQ